MTLSTLLSELVRLHIKLQRDKGTIRFRASAGTLTAEIRMAMVEHKSELLARLPLPLEEGLWVQWGLCEDAEPNVVHYSITELILLKKSPSAHRDAVHAVKSIFSGAKLIEARPNEDYLP